MYVRPAPDPMSSMWAWIAYDLRFYRKKHGMTGTDVGRLLNCVRSTVSRLESGELRLNEQQAEVLDRHWGTGGHFLRLLTYAKLGHDPDWLKQYEDYEARACLIKTYDGQLIPVPLQIPEYARALLLAGRDPNVEGSLERRMARQAILERADAPDLWVLVAETVFAPLIGGREVMRKQLERLLDVSNRPNVMLRVVPNSAEANEGLDGPFKVIRVPERDVAYVEASGGGRLILGAAEVQSFGVKYERIGAEALSRSDSRNLIMNLMEAMT